MAEDTFSEFYTEVKAIEQRDSVLTSEQQIARLLRPGSTYFNLNPYEVLQLDPELSMTEAKKQYRKLSILVHPDKNQDNKDDAEKAFEIVCKAWKSIENGETRKKYLDLIAEAKERVKYEMEHKNDNKKASLTPDEMKEEHRKMTLKLFAEAEQRRRHLEKRDMEERKRQREQEIEQEEQSKLRREWTQNFEESRESRINSWKQFQEGTVVKKTKKLKTLKPPKTKAESR